MLLQMPMSSEADRASFTFVRPLEVVDFGVNIQQSIGGEVFFAYIANVFATICGTTTAACTGAVQNVVKSLVGCVGGCAGGC